MIRVGRRASIAAGLIGVGDTLVVDGHECTVKTAASGGVGLGRMMLFVFEDGSNMTALATQMVISLEVSVPWRMPTPSSPTRSSSTLSGGILSLSA